LRLHLGSRVTPAQKVASLAADGFNVDVLAGLRLEEPRRRLRDVRVERARQSFVAGHYNQQNVFFCTLRQQRMLRLTPVSGS
jgi:hypothetical protein